MGSEAKNGDLVTNESVTFSIKFLYEYIFASRREIFMSAILLILGTSFYVASADKQYAIRGTINQTDLSDVIQPSIIGNVPLALLAGAANQSQPINNYLIMITSPGIDAELMRDPHFIPILFKDSYTRDPNKPGVWTHVPSIAFTIKKKFCDLLFLECPSVLSAVQVSQRLSDRLSISPTVMPDQSVLSPIGSNSSYDISFVGKDPATSLRLLESLHNATNAAIQNRDIVFATEVERNLSKRIRLIDNNDAREQMINVLSDQERKLAVLTAAKLDYAARWIVAPTVSNWPVKPNLPLLYALALLGSILVGCLARFSTDQIRLYSSGTRSLGIGATEARHKSLR